MTRHGIVYGAAVMAAADDAATTGVRNDERGAHDGGSNLADALANKGIDELRD